MFFIFISPRENAFCIFLVDAIPVLLFSHFSSISITGGYQVKKSENAMCKLILKRLYFTGLICHCVVSLWQHGSLGVKYVLGFSGDAQTAYDQLTQELRHTHSHTQFAHPCSVAWMVYEPHICQSVTGWQLKLPALCPLSSRQHTHTHKHSCTNGRGHMKWWHQNRPQWLETMLPTTK